MNEYINKLSQAFIHSLQTTYLSALDYLRPISTVGIRVLPISFDPYPGLSSFFLKFSDYLCFAGHFLLRVSRKIPRQFYNLQQTHKLLSIYCQAI